MAIVIWTTYCALFRPKFLLLSSPDHITSTVSSRRFGLIVLFLSRTDFNGSTVPKMSSATNNTTVRTTRKRKALDVLPAEAHRDAKRPRRAVSRAVKAKPTTSRRRDVVADNPENSGPDNKIAPFEPPTATIAGNRKYERPRKVADAAIRDDLVAFVLDDADAKAVMALKDQYVDTLMQRRPEWKEMEKEAKAEAEEKGRTERWEKACKRAVEGGRVPPPLPPKPDRHLRLGSKSHCK